jgi:hypothetical protein
LKKVDTKLICNFSNDASAAPRPENSDSDEKDALFGLDTQINITAQFNLLKCQMLVPGRLASSTEFP